MISKTLDENAISFIAEESDDLLIIRRLIKKGDIPFLLTFLNFV